MMMWDLYIDRRASLEPSFGMPFPSLQTVVDSHTFFINSPTDHCSYYDPVYPLFSLETNSHPVLTRGRLKACQYPRRLHHHNKYYHHYDGGGRHHNHSESRHPLQIVTGFPQIHPRRAYRVGVNDCYGEFDERKFAPTVREYSPHVYPEQIGRKKALCIGINYAGHQTLENSQALGELSGCIKDAVQISSFLSEHWDSSSRGAVKIKVLRDDSKNDKEMPTKSNIIKAMRWLVKGARREDSLVFHYSGHGGQIKDQNGDEPDGYDEVIYPVDDGYIVDDDMHKLMVKPLPTGCRLTALFDCCHSGSALDLPYVWDDFGGLFRGGSVTRKWIRRKSTQASVISLSSAKDDRVSMDTPQGGAMSDAFIMSLKHDAYQTYVRFFASINEIMTRKHKQTPQLCCSSNIDTNGRFVL
ncbi:caspase domain-containing protein [Armillaria novae-zelandiae]|uniref:Caspase domain-containing protein n=1 Tax=Armillaria novae-zelandiae TaxID=153914 RepID=A0AA39P0Q7_9AGAR|nr:caspase domain-containing protein [Armillaria novae-zelandiae]